MCSQARFYASGKALDLVHRICGSDSPARYWAAILARFPHSKQPKMLTPVMKGSNKAASIEKLEHALQFARAGERRHRIEELLSVSLA